MNASSRSLSVVSVSDDDESLDAALEESEHQNHSVLTHEVTRHRRSLTNEREEHEETRMESDEPSRLVRVPTDRRTQSPIRTHESDHHINTMRMFDTLEAFSTDTEDGEILSSHSFQGLLDQFHTNMDHSRFNDIFPFSQFLQTRTRTRTVLNNNNTTTSIFGTNQKYQILLAQIQMEESVSTQIQGLSDLCELLSLSTEETLAVSTFHVDVFVPIIVSLIHLPSSMDVLLLAARALSTILDLFPATAIQRATTEHVIPFLCEKLLEIQYMDVAELALQILETIVCKADVAFTTASTVVVNVPTLCAQYRIEVIQENGIVALLQYIDFFPLEIQRRAARIVCQLCTDFPLSMQDKMQQGLPYITNLLRSFDNELLLSSYACLQKLGESAVFLQNEEFASMIATDEICGLLLKKLTSYASLDGSGGSSALSQLSPEGYTSMLRFLSCLLSCVSSDMSAVSVIPSVSHLRFVKLPSILTALLAKQEVISENQLLCETLKLVIVVLPISEELSLTKAIPPAMLKLAHDILSLITRVYDVTSQTNLRHDCLDVIFRSCLLMHTSRQPLTVQECTELSRLAAFLARVLRPKRDDMTVSSPAKADKDLVPVQLALKIVEVPLQHPSAREVAKDIFERHGVSTIIRFYASGLENKYIRGSVMQDICAFSVRLTRDYLGDESLIISEMAKLKRLVDRLQTTLATSSASDNDQTASLVNELLQLGNFVAQGDNFLTAHEIACSGLVKVLIQLLSVDKGRQAFSQMQKVQSTTSAGQEFVSSLLRCLQDAISSEKEAFSISSSGGCYAGLSSGSITTDLDRLTQHIKVHVLIEETKSATEPDNEDQSSQQVDCYDQEESEGLATKKTLSNWKESKYYSNKRTVHETVVLVEPLARIETMEDYIADKLFGRGGDAGVRLDELESIGVESEEGGESESGEFANDVVKHRRVIAVYKGQVLPADMSILEAIVKFRGVDANGNGKLDVDLSASVSGGLSTHGSPFWIASSHDITFRVATSLESGEDVIILEPAAEDGKIAEAFSCLPASTQFVITEPWWDDVWELLLLFKLVRKQCIGKPFGTKLNFVNSYLSLQVRHALQHPVRVVTNSLPDWCFRLVNEFSFVLEFETRCHFMYATTCGCSRAIQYLCRSVWRKAVMEEQSPVRHVRLSNTSGRRRHRDGSSRTRTSGLDNISQMVKLPRLKVRVARSRLLQSAMKLVALYGGKKAVIEIEFLGEVGTGLGPTTEFYTLVCQQIQSKQLQLWRDDDRNVVKVSKSADEEQKREPLGDDVNCLETDQDNGSLAIRGYHRVAVYHCSKCKALHIPTCSVHRQLLTHEKKAADTKNSSTSDDDSNQTSRKSLTSARRQASRNSIPQCVQCLDNHDWHSAAACCDCKPNHDAVSKCKESDSVTNVKAGYSLKWWILSDEEAQYLAKVFPRHAKRIKHPVLQCAHCDTVNFPGTDAGIVVMDGDRMVSRSGRRMFERDYRAVTKHVSPLCEGTPLNVMISALTRSEVDMLVNNLAQSPEVLESEVEALYYLSEAALAGCNIGSGPAVTAPTGLYPKPYLKDNDLDEGKTSVQLHESSSIATLEADALSVNRDEVDVLTWFRFLGRFVCQAILDERLLNLPFARPFMRALRGEKMVGSGVSVEKSLSFVEELDPSIANSMRYLHNLAVKYAAEEASGEVASKDVAVWTKEVDSLCLSFTMVGADDIPLEASGDTKLVTLPTLHRYVALNLDFLLDRTIKSQVQAFQQGFEQICGGLGNHQLFSFLQAFDIRELEALLSDRGSGSSMWDRDGVDLREHMVCDHGYTADSRAIANLVSILCELSIDEQRLFVRFVTGANRLPLGGLRNLEPKLTVVRKLTEVNDGNNTEENDAVLPSASTCTNYLKLPDYSTREIMKERLLYCIHEGKIVVSYY